jgi:hypothetical protein
VGHHRSRQGARCPPAPHTRPGPGPCRAAAPWWGRSGHRCAPRPRGGAAPGSRGSGRAPEGPRPAVRSAASEAPPAARTGGGARSPPRPPGGRGTRGAGSRGGPAPLPTPRRAGLRSQCGLLGHHQGDGADEGRPDAGAPLAGDHGGVGGHHAPGGAGRVYPCRLSRSIQLKSAVSLCGR